MARRTADNSPTLPRLVVGTFEYRGVVFLRADHLAQWLDDAVDQLDPLDPTRDAIADVRAMVAEAGGLRG